MIILFLQNGDGVGEHKISNERSQCIVCFIKFLNIFQGHQDGTNGGGRQGGDVGQQCNCNQDLK